MLFGYIVGFKLIIDCGLSFFGFIVRFEPIIDCGLCLSGYIVGFKLIIDCGLSCLVTKLVLNSLLIVGCIVWLHSWF